MRPTTRLGSWNLPIRRSSLGSWNLPIRRTLGTTLAPSGWQANAVELTADQVRQFLDRHPELTRGFVPLDASIPAYGMAVADSVFGNVVIFKDAKGTLRFTGNVPADVAEQINKPPYVSPIGESPLDGLLRAVPWVVGAFLALSLLKVVRK